MGRLFWKFFFFIWLAQLTAILGVSATFWLERQQERARWEAAGGDPAFRRPEWAHRPSPFPADGRPPFPPPGGESAPPPGGPPAPPHPPHRSAALPPLEPLIAALFASLTFAALLAWYFSKPIRSLRAAFDAAAAGNLQVRLGPAMGERRDELADLGRDFDRMAGRLCALMAGQRRLLHDVSHELRSPLARLQAAIGLLRQQPARLEDSLARIERESVRMDRLVGELLTLSRLEAGQAPAMDEDIPLAELLADIAGDAGFEAEASGRRLVCRVAGELFVRGNGELLQRAVENVLRNAIRYTPVGGDVVLEAGALPEAGRLRLAVLDSGPGVPEGELKSIFAPFFRSGEARGNDGYGLGLAIAKRVVEAHGGTIAAANRPEGGLGVEMLLPAAAGGA